MNTFSTLGSPSKKLLNFEEFTPAKVMVGCDINGWLETHKKSPLPQPKRKPPKCFHMRINADNRLKENVPPTIKPISSTHASNSQNMLSIIKLKVQMEAFSTKCKTSETKNNSIGGNKKSQDQIQVDVSAFEEGVGKQEMVKKGENAIDQFFHIYEAQSSQQLNMQGGLMSDRLQERKRRISKILSFNKMRNSSRAEGQRGRDFSKKINLINKSQQIVKGKLSTNQQRALNQIVKQGEFNFIRVLNKVSPQNSSSSPLNICKQKKINSYRFMSNEIRIE